MADSEPAEDPVFHVDGNELTEEQMKTKIDDLMVADTITVSCDEKRQIFSKFEPDSYFMCMGTKVGGAGELVNSITDQPERKRAKALFLGGLLGKLGGQFRFMKKVIHAQEVEDCVAMGMDPATKVNYRKGEKAEK